jgi:hypothetical protein
MNGRCNKTGLVTCGCSGYYVVVWCGCDGADGVDVMERMGWM